MPSHRPLTRWEVVWHRLQNGCTLAEATDGVGISWREAKRAVLEDPSFMEAYRLGASKRLEKYARREAEREVECMLSGRGYARRPMEDLHGEELC